MVPAEEKGRNYPALLSVARRRLCELGLRPPFDLDALRSALERERGTTIALVPTDELPVGAAFGVTGSQGGVEVVLYESRTTASHQQLIVLHEFAHMLLRHPPSAVLHLPSEVSGFHEIDASAVAMALGKGLPDAARPVAGAQSSAPSRRQRRGWWRPRTPGSTSAPSSASLGPRIYARVCEHEAETLATILLDWLSGDSGAAAGASPDPVVERLTDALGHRWSPR